MKFRLFDSLKTQIIFFIIISVTFSTGIAASAAIYLNSENIIISLISVIFFSLLISLYVDRRIIRPLNQLIKSAEVISKGGINVSLDNRCKGKLGRLTDSFQAVINRVKEQTLAVQQIANGYFDINLKQTSQDDVLSGGLIAMRNTINDIVLEMDQLHKEIRNGNLKAQASEVNYNGKWKTLIGDSNHLINALAAPIENAAVYIGRISQGDIPSQITAEYPGDFNNMKNSLNTCIDVMNGFICEMAKLTVGVQEGKLDIRGDASAFNGSWSELIEGTNQMIHAFAAPIHITTEYVERIGRGEIPPPITDPYYGDFNHIKESINSCIYGLDGLVEGSKVLEKMSVNDYTDRVAGNYRGIYSSVAHSINSVNDNINHVFEVLNHISMGDLSDLERLKSEGKRSENDQLMPCIILMIETINLLYIETDDMWRAAMEGRLDFRGDQKKFKAKFEEIIEGINEMMDALIEPIKEAHSVLIEMAKGNLHVRMNGEYKGDHGELKVALNETLESLLSYIRDISEMLSEIGKGNLNLTVTANYKGDFIEIKDSLAGIINALNDALGNIDEASEQVATGANQVSAGSQALSQGATEQAGVIQELNASVSELANQTKQNAANANQASRLADTAKDNAIKGDRQMNEMLRAISEINESSNNISKIIKVIDDIAFQTNILALNAAVEAARAGQYGKGFAVVAEEVRNLAARCANAARETTNLIEGSIDKVQAGTEITNNTADALREIVIDIENSAGLVKEISNASNDQATGIAQISKGLEQVAQVVQNNSATAEESAASSEELSGQAEMLKEMVGRFMLKRVHEIKRLDQVSHEYSSVGSGIRIVMSQDGIDKY
jgi:Methyl-accepting chemotaxis protein